MRRRTTYRTSRLTSSPSSDWVNFHFYLTRGRLTRSLSILDVRWAGPLPSRSITRQWGLVPYSEVVCRQSPSLLDYRDAHGEAGLPSGQRNRYVLLGCPRRRIRLPSKYGWDLAHPVAVVNAV